MKLTFNRLLGRCNSLMILIMLLNVGLLAMSCGNSDESVVIQGEGDSKKRVRIIESDRIFTTEELNAIGWKDKKDLLLDYPGTTVARWGYLNTAEVGVLIYANARDAKTLGTAAADVQTFHNAENGEAPGDGSMDRTECSSASPQMPIKNFSFGSSERFVSYIDGDPDAVDFAGQARYCPTRFPTYNDYTVIGNIVMMCEGDGAKPFEPSTNCRELESWLLK